MGYEIAICIGGIIIIGEGIYLALCRSMTKRVLINGDIWLGAKMLSFVLGFIISGGIYVLYYALKSYIIETILIALVITTFIGFIYLNKYIGLAMAKRR